MRTTVSTEDALDEQALARIFGVVHQPALH